MPPNAASSGPCATRREPVSWRCTIDISNVSEESSAGRSPASGREENTREPRRWTLHGLNNGVIFRLTYTLVRRLPWRASYAIGDACSWLAAQLMPATRAALIDNLQAAVPDADSRTLENLARCTLRAYSRDTIDFLRALSLDGHAAAALFTKSSEYEVRLRQVLLQKRGAILVTGHHGNWEIGSVLIRRVLQQRLSIVAMAESDAGVNDIRHRIRDSLGVDTIEVRQSLDTALRIRRTLSENGIVAMLMDRHLGRDRVRVTLLGRPASFLRTPALMAYLTGAPLLPCFIERTESQPPFSVFLGEPIVVRSNLPRDEAIQRAAQEFADLLTVRVRRHPEHWYHFYRYWDAQRDSYNGLE